MFLATLKSQNINNKKKPIHVSLPQGIKQKAHFRRSCILISSKFYLVCSLEDISP